MREGRQLRARQTKWRACKIPTLSKPEPEPETEAAPKCKPPFKESIPNLEERS
jgi:hypothetical protein